MVKRTKSLVLTFAQSVGGRAHRRHQASLLGVLFAAHQVQRHVGFVAPDPTVVARTNLEDVAGAEFDLSSIIHPDHAPPSEHDPNVRDLAGWSPGKRLHVLRPLPPGLIGRAANY